MLRWAGILLSAVSAPLLAESLPLPEHRDVPEDYSAVICPDEAAAATMLRVYHQESSYGNLETPKFMEGLTATGCEQHGGPLEIDSVIDRRTIGTGQDGPFIAFKAHRPDGTVIFGTVDEGGNNRHPRTPLERWTQLHAPDGFIEAGVDGLATYRCSSPNAAQAVISAIPKGSDTGDADPRQATAFKAALKAQGCAPASGKFRVTEVHSSAFISLGLESGEDWTALTATDASGATVGLVYDASLM